MLFTEDIKKATVPIAIYISMDESESEYNNIVKVLAENDYAAKNDNKYYKNMYVCRPLIFSSNLYSGSTALRLRART